MIEYLPVAKEAFEFVVGLVDRWDEHQARWAAVAAAREQNRIVEVEIGGLRAETHRSLQRLGHTLAIQTGMLSVLRDNQADLADGLQRLEAAVEQGVGRLATHLRNQESREFEIRTRKALGAYQLLLELATEGERPQESELLRVIDASEDLDNWAETYLREHPPGAPSRLPYLMARALSVRARGEALRMQAEMMPTRRRVCDERARRLQEALLVEVERDLRTIGDASPFARATALAFPIAQLVYLRRGLHALLGRPYPQAEWDDSLGPLRSALHSPGPVVARSARVPLATLGDYLWYLEFSGQDPRTLDVHSVESVPLDALLEPLGVGLPGVPAAAIPAIQAANTPKGRERLNAGLRAELGEAT